MFWFWTAIQWLSNIQGAGQLAIAVQRWAWSVLKRKSPIKRPYSFEMHFIARPFGTHLIRHDLRDEWTMPLGESEVRLQIHRKDGFTVKTIGVRFGKYPERQMPPDDVHPDIVRIVDVADYYVEKQDSTATHLQVTPEGEPGGVRGEYDRQVHCPRDKSLCLRVKVLASQKWSGFIGFIDRDTYDYVRRPIRVDPNLPAPDPKAPSDYPG